MNQKTEMELLEELDGKTESGAYSPLAMTIISLFLILLGSVILYFEVEQFKLTNQSKDWPSVQGHIIQSSVQELIQTNSSDQAAARSTRTRKGSRWKVDLRYMYKINGEEFKGSKLKLDEQSEYFVEFKDAKKFAASYEGKDVTVYYSPKDFNLSTLTNKLTLSDYKRIIACILFLCLGCYGFYFGLNHKPKKKKSRLPI